MSRLRARRTAVALLLLTACGGGSPTASLTTTPTTVTSLPGATTTVATVSIPTVATTPAITAATTAITKPITTATTVQAVPVTQPPQPSGPAFSANVSAVTAAQLGASWKPDCPVPPEQLRLIQLTHWGFDDQAHTGALVANASVTDALIAVFRRLYDARFPIRRMTPIDAFGGDDDASMAADNTSAFNCRNAVATGPPRWSVHAYGLAIDVNPIENPYILEGDVLPPAGRDYRDRSRYKPGMAVPGGVLTSAFDAANWFWGGVWQSPDYQHFSSTGG